MKLKGLATAIQSAVDMQEIRAAVIICPECKAPMDAQEVLGGILPLPSDEYRDGWLDAVEGIAIAFKAKRDKYIACSDTEETNQFLKYNRIYGEICEFGDFQSAQAKIIDRQRGEQI